MSRIAIFTPHPPGHISGNNTTRRRIAAGLRRLGHEVREIHILSKDPAGALGRLEPLPVAQLDGFDILHALHAFRTGVAVRALSRELGIPYVVSITGTDVHEDFEQLDKRTDILAVLRDANAILCAARETVESLRKLDGIATPCLHVPKGVELPRAIVDPPEKAPDTVPFLLVAAWREVKNNIFPLLPLARLAIETTRVRLRFAGPVLDPAYHSKWLGNAESFPFAEDLGAVEPQLMNAQYQAASVVLNTSHSEGGANSVLEAMAQGVPVLASDIPGNRAFIKFQDALWENSTGVLYRTRPVSGQEHGKVLHDGEDFYEKARRLALDADLRRRIGRNAREAAAREHSIEKEIEKVLEAYGMAGGLRCG